MKRDLHYLFSLLLIVTLTLSGCKKEDDDDNNDPPPPSSSSTVLVSCEGAFLASNASISAYNTEDGTVADNVFESVNGYSIGDILQSLTVDGQRIFLVVNNSGKVEIINGETYEAEMPILGLSSPRHLVKVSDTKAYVTNNSFGAGNDISILDIQNNTVSGNIDLDLDTEGILVNGGFAYACAPYSNELQVISTQTDQVVSTIDVGLGANHIVQDDQGDIWILRFELDAMFAIIEMEVVHVSPALGAVLGTYTVPQPWNYTNRLVANGNDVFVLNGDVFYVNTVNSTLEDEPVIDMDVNTYALGVDPQNGDIYVGEASGFGLGGKVYRFNSDYQPLDTVTVGVGPNGFHFFD